MPRLNKKQITELVKKARDKSQRTVDSLGGANNHPQISHVITGERARVEAYNNVLEALNGDAVMLKICAEET